MFLPDFTISISFINNPVMLSSYFLITLSDAFACLDWEPPIAYILFGWSGICGQFGLCSLLFYFVTSPDLIIFVLLYYIVTFKLFFFTYYIFACFICIFFCWIDWLYSNIIVSAQCDLGTFFSKYIMFLTFKPFLWF